MDHWQGCARKNVVTTDCLSRVWPRVRGMANVEAKAMSTSDGLPTGSEDDPGKLCKCGSPLVESMAGMVCGKSRMHSADCPYPHATGSERERETVEDVVRAMLSAYGEWLLSPAEECEEAAPWVRRIRAALAGSGEPQRRRETMSEQVKPGTYSGTVRPISDDAAPRTAFYHRAPREGEQEAVLTVGRAPSPHGEDVEALVEWWRLRKHSGCFDVTDRAEMDDIIAALRSRPVEPEPVATMEALEDRLGLHERIEIGERVTIRMKQNNVLPWGIKFDAILLRRPQGEGDVYEFDAPDGTRFCLNGNGSEFVGFWRAAPTEESQEER